MTRTLRDDWLVVGQDGGDGVTDATGGTGGAGGGDKVGHDLAPVGAVAGGSGGAGFEEGLDVRQLVVDTLADFRVGDLLLLSPAGERALGLA